jgi:hypothetical protein
MIFKFHWFKTCISLFIFSLCAAILSLFFLSNLMYIAICIGLCIVFGYPISIFFRFKSPILTKYLLFIPILRVDLAEVHRLVMVEKKTTSTVELTKTAQEKQYIAIKRDGSKVILGSNYYLNLEGKDMENSLFRTMKIKVEVDMVYETPTTLR